MATIPVIVDCDVGIDDAQALMLLLKHPAVRVVAVTAVAGNVELPDVVRNICSVIAAAELETPPPVFKGAEQQLLPLTVGPAKRATEWHGSDGLGDAALPAPDMSMVVEGEHAAAAMGRIIMDSDVPVRLVAVGPLTNVALAVKLQPRLVDNLDGFYIMGGCMHGRGNSTPASEFNAIADPEAAAMCMQSFPDTVIVTWETCVAHPLAFDFVDEWMSDSTPRSKFLRDVSKFLVDKSHVLGMGLVIPDGLAAAVACDRTCLRRVENVHVEVETAGRHSRGAFVCDFSDLLKAPRNGHVVHELDMDRVKQMLLASVGKAEWPAPNPDAPAPLGPPPEAANPAKAGAGAPAV